MDQELALRHTLFQRSVGADAVYDEKGNMLRPAQEPNTACLLFSCKTRLGMRETVRIGGDQDRGAVPIDIRSLTSDQLAQFKERILGEIRVGENARGGDN